MAYLQDVLTAGEAIAAYVAGQTFETFETSGAIRDAVSYQLTIIGEASGRPSAETRSRMPEIPWPQVKRMRNILVHDYSGVDLFIVWQTASLRVPELAEAVRKHLPAE